jgi:hypothetical protein
MSRKHYGILRVARPRAQHRPGREATRGRAVPAQFVGITFEPESNNWTRNGAPEMVRDAPCPVAWSASGGSEIRWLELTSTECDKTPAGSSGR